jgi:hypothetical protein
MNSDSAFFPDAVIPVYDEAGNVIETHEHASGVHKSGEFLLASGHSSPLERIFQRRRTHD